MANNTISRIKLFLYSVTQIKSKIIRISCVINSVDIYDLTYSLISSLSYRFYCHFAIAN